MTEHRHILQSLVGSYSLKMGEKQSKMPSVEAAQLQDFLKWNIFIQIITNLKHLCPSLMLLFLVLFINNLSFGRSLHP